MIAHDSILLLLLSGLVVNLIIGTHLRQTDFLQRATRLLTSTSGQRLSVRE